MSKESLKINSKTDITSNNVYDYYYSNFNNAKIIDIKSIPEIWNLLSSSIPSNISNVEIEKILLNPVLKNKTTFCKIVIKNDFKFGRFFPKYYLYLNANSKFLICAKTVFSATGNFYHISYEIDNYNEHGCCYLGRLDSNFIGTEFNLFGKGKSWKESNNSEEYKRQFASIQYVKQIFL